LSKLAEGLKAEKNMNLFFLYFETIKLSTSFPILITLLSFVKIMEMRKIASIFGHSEFIFIPDLGDIKS